jgi:endoglucanase
MRAPRILAALSVALLVASCSGGGGDGGREYDRPDADGYTGASDALAGLGAGRVSGDDGATIEAVYALTEPDSITVTVEPPTGADEMQVSLDASYGDAAWQPVAGSVELPAIDEGYVEVFARFRTSGGAPSRPLVAGVVVDRTWAAATSAGDGQPHAPSSVGVASPDTLVVRVETGRVIRNGQENYSFDSPPAGDEVKTAETDNGDVRIVERNGVFYGAQVADGVDLIARADTVVGYPVSTEALDDAEAYRVSVDGDGEKPVSVRRVTRPAGFANVTTSKVVSPAVHDVYVQLPEPLEAGKTYEVTFPGDAVQPATLTFDPATTRSVALHANQIGYRPGDSLKVAYASAWAGSGIALPDALPFTVVDASTGDVVLEGTGTKREAGPDGEMGKGDVTGTDVQALDFSALDTPGTYRVCAPSLGCSEDFAISETSTWRRAAVAVARAMYHQRSGIAMEQPYTAVDRPRGFHPDDGVQVRQAAVGQVEIDAAEEGAFDRLTASATDEVVAGAYGGHFDAGDWDRRIDHLAYLRTALDLVELAPETWATLDLDIPESGDAVPDIIDEGLWDLDMYMRMQTPDGGIRGGIESDEHPLPRETSWTQTQQVFAFAPDAQASYIYAGVAAETARVLAEYDAARAETYATTAVAAMNWAEDNPIEELNEEKAAEVRGARAAAGAALYRLTGDEQWQAVFLDSTTVDDGPIDMLGCTLLRECDALWIYAQTEQPGVRADVKQNAIQTFVSSAGYLADAQDTTLYGWTLVHPAVPLVWGLGPSTPKTVGLVRAYALTDDERFCKATLQAATFSLGANPLDTVFLTGMGRQNVEHPLIVDNTYGGVPVWPGTPVYGLHRLNDVSDDSWVSQYYLSPAGASPDPNGVPYMQSFYDVGNLPMFNEFTVHQSHAVALYAYGALAGMGC